MIKQTLKSFAGLQSRVGQSLDLQNNPERLPTGFLFLFFGELASTVIYTHPFCPYPGLSNSKSHMMFKTYPTLCRRKMLNAQHFCLVSLNVSLYLWQQNKNRFFSPQKFLKTICSLTEQGYNSTHCEIYSWLRNLW